MNEKIKYILEKTEYIIPNLDIDGFFTAAILKQVKNTIKTVGFSNSHDLVYFFEEMRGSFNKENTLYIDLYTKNCMCIDQHVISFDKNYNESIKNKFNNLNPNVEFGRVGCVGEYYWKYPFSSAMWLIYCFNRIGINIDFDYNKIVFDDITLAELFFHADSMLYNKIDKNHRYEKNILKWWDMLLEGNNNNNVTELHKIYMSLTDERIEYTHKKIGEFLQYNFRCKKNGGYSDIKNSLVKYSINEFINLICNNMKVEPIIINFRDINLYEKKFNENKKVLIETKQQFDDIVNKDNIFSFAFVFNNTLNYSYS